MKRQFDCNDPSAFDEVYNAYYRKLTLFARALIEDKEEARDIVSESFLKVWVKKLTFENEGQIQSYFYTVVKNACIDYLRKNKLKKKLAHELIEASPETENLIARKFQESELVCMIYERINQLPVQMQKVFKLTYLEGRTRSEIAKMLLLSENTIRNTNYAATKALRIKCQTDEGQC